MKKPKAKQRPAVLSACMIVRNEEANIARALRSLQNAVDEIVVVDTGSDDRTPDIAASEGARLFHFDWQDDFAAARNESLIHARGQWVLYIDADEALVEPQPGELRRLCSRLQVHEAGAYFTIRNPVDEHGQNEMVGEQWRLFRRTPGVCFEGRIHEQLRWPAGQPRLRGAASHHISIQHWGYVAAGDLLQRKGARNRRLLELSLAEEPNEPAHYFHLGRQYAWERDFGKALPALEQAIALWTARGQPPDGYVPSMFSTAALAALRESQFGKVLEIEARTPGQLASAELVFVAGVALARLGQTTEAITHLNRAWQDSTLARATGNDPSTWTWRPLLALSEIYQGQGCAEEARAALTKALEFAPERDDLMQALKKVESEQEPFVSACMIVRDEEDNLRRWLPLVRAAVDELIVVDTGSSDATATVAGELGASVHHFPWSDDFSAARNESLRHARGEWIMWIDADDELLESVPGALRQLCRTLPAEAHGCWLRVHSRTAGEGQSTTTLRQWRLFRNHLGLHFRGRVHEQLTAPAESGALHVIEQEEIQVRHWGYAGSPDVLGKKVERNRRLLQLSISEDPHEPFHHCSLGKQLVLQQQFSAAREELDQAMVLWQKQGQPAYGYVGPMFAVAACCALNLGFNDRVLELEAACPPQAVSSDLLYYAAIACQRLGHADDAIGRLKRAITDTSVHTATETDPATATWQPRLLLAQLHTQLGRREEAYGMAMEAIDSMPEQPEVFLGGAVMAIEMGHPDDALRICRRLLSGQADESSKARARQLIAGVNRRLEAPAAAR